MRCRSKKLKWCNSPPIRPSTESSNKTVSPCGRRSLQEGVANIRTKLWWILGCLLRYRIQSSRLHYLQHARIRNLRTISINWNLGSILVSFIQAPLKQLLERLLADSRKSSNSKMLCSSANCPVLRLLWSSARKPGRAVYNNKRGVFLVLILRRFQALISRLELKVPASSFKIKTWTLFLNPSINPSNQNIIMASHKARAKTESSTSTDSESLTALWLPMISTSALRRSYRKGLSQMEARFKLASWLSLRLRPFSQSKET